MENATATRLSPQPQALLTLSGNYLIAPGNSQAALHNDLGCVLDCANEIVSLLATDLYETNSILDGNSKGLARMLFCAGHFVTMAKNIAKAIEVAA